MGLNRKLAARTGEIADGMIMFGAVHPGVIGYLIDNMRIGAERVGPFAVWAGNLTALSVRAQPQSLPAALRDQIMAFCGACRASEEPAATRHLKSYSGYMQNARPAHEHLLTEDVMRAATLTGTPSQIIDTIGAMQAAGVGQVAIQPVVSNRAAIVQFLSEIMAHLS